MSPLDLLLPVALLAVIFGICFAAIEAALLATSRQGLERGFEELNTAAKTKQRILKYHEDSARTLAAISLGKVLADTTWAVIFTAYLFERIEGLWLPLILSVVVTALVSFIAVSVSPRTLGRRSPVKTLTKLAFMITLARAILDIPARILVHISNAFTAVRDQRIGPFTTEDEIRELVDRASETESLEDEERNMIHGVFELGERKIRELMVPRTDMVTINQEANATNAMRLFVRSGFSRVPVIGEGVDDLLGMLYFKDVMRAIHSPWDPGQDRAVTEIMRPAKFFPEFLDASKVMEEMRNSRVHAGILVGEYGGVSGIVTIEDILEEIVGDISDEHDRLAQSAEEISSQEYRVPARMPIDEVGQLFGLDIEDEDVDTIGGLLAKTVGMVPIKGTEAEAHGLHMLAERTSGRRKQVSTLIVKKVVKDVEEASD